ncbi:MAG: hypothetical protein HZB55_00185 [Deltaproteobacteria bacterium]|nr:hypothetical protein [Deltaproteobacteria bacterium]
MKRILAVLTVTALLASGCCPFFLPPPPGWGQGRGNYDGDYGGRGRGHHSRGY